jgi:pimeloyl-ACP methyl ester carboxylesterase
MELYAVRKGTGKPVLALHGLLSDHRQLYALLPALHGCEVYFVDLLGCGKSSREHHEDIIAANVTLLRAFCKAKRIDTVIGYSIGGIIAEQLRLPNTILISTFCTDPRNNGTLQRVKRFSPAIQTWLLTHEASTQRFIQTYLKNTPVPGIQHASVAHATQYLLAAKKDYSAHARRLPRTLVVHGSKDVLIHHSYGEELARVTKGNLLLAPENHLSILKNKTVHNAISAFVFPRGAPTLRG